MELQEMINIIQEFLSNNNMNLNAKKSKIISNQKNVDFSFYINNQLIEMIDKSDLVRILGVHWTLDGSYKKTLKKVKDDFLRQISAITHKYSPGKIMTHLVNTVIIPQLIYKLQCIPISQSFLEKIYARL